MSGRFTRADSEQGEPCALGLGLSEPEEMDVGRTLSRPASQSCAFLASGTAHQKPLRDAPQRRRESRAGSEIQVFLLLCFIPGSGTQVPRTAGSGAESCREGPAPGAVNARWRPRAGSALLPGVLGALGEPGVLLRRRAALRRPLCGPVLRLSRRRVMCKSFASPSTCPGLGRPVLRVNCSSLLANLEYSFKLSCSRACHTELPCQCPG